MSTSQSPELMGGNLFGERDFASVSRAVEMGSFWIIQVSPNPMTRVLVRDRDWGDVATSPGLLESPPPTPPELAEVAEASRTLPWSLRGPRGPSTPRSQTSGFRNVSDVLF